VNPYLELTREFNRGELRAIVSSDQAVVLLRLSVASKDGDWILRESTEALGHVLHVLAGHGARYRFGAPLDVRWMAGGWSAHFEFDRGGLRLRTDFVTRPPRLSSVDLAALWEQAAKAEWPHVDPRRLVALKQTGRERDYAVIGELARLIEAQPAPVPAEELYRDVWGGLEYHTLRHRNTVYVGVNRLRRALAEVASGTEVIVTTPEGWRIADGVDAAVVRRQGSEP